VCGQSGRNKETLGFGGNDAAQGKIVMNSDKARERAERHFRKEERAQDGRKAMIEYESQALATREKTVRLRELRLAKEALARSIIAL
jgi:uncharacterized lipoprotein YmbA